MRFNKSSEHGNDAVGILESLFKHALACLSLFLLCLYMSV